MAQGFYIVHIHPNFGVTPCVEKDIHGKQFFYTDNRHNAIRRVTALRMAGVQAWFEPNTEENRKRYNRGIMHR